MKITVLEYDQEGGHQGVHELARLYKAGWEMLIPLKYLACCGIFRTTLIFNDPAARN
jgi:hypothetical protein